MILMSFSGDLETHTPGWENRQILDFWGIDFRPSFNEHDPVPRGYRNAEDARLVGEWIQSLLIAETPEKMIDRAHSGQYNQVASQIYSRWYQGNSRKINAIVNRILQEDPDHWPPSIIVTSSGQGIKGRLEYPHIGHLAAYVVRTFSPKVFGQATDAGGGITHRDIYSVTQSWLVHQYTRLKRQYTVAKNQIAKKLPNLRESVKR